MSSQKPDMTEAFEIGDIVVHPAYGEAAIYAIHKDRATLTIDGWAVNVLLSTLTLVEPPPQDRQQERHAEDETPKQERTNPRGHG